MKTNQSAAQHNGLVQAPSGIWLPQQPSSKQQVLTGKASANNRQPWTEKVLVGKTLWEWMSLLLVPLLVGIGTIVVTGQQTYAQNALNQQLHDSDQHQHASDQSIAQQARYDDLLKNYRDGIDTLLLTSGLRTVPPGSDVRRIARSRTLDILRQVDISRKEAVIAYLANLGLVQGEYPDTAGNWYQGQPIISLSNANLRGVHLDGANLNGANLNRADLRGADLRGTSLDRAFLGRADLRAADLRAAFLNGTYLREANLGGTNFRGADLGAADLRAANFTTPKQLSTAASLSGTIMPDGTKHP